METVKNAANYVSESVKGTSATASKEANKSVAKDNDASLGSRATAAKDAASDKVDEFSHNNKAEVHKEAAQH
ncbi:glucose-repressible protein Grg1 [Xylogone sp. PMI_703]|nr:glucose-repressible protein Grg1 [Xylogone sp. PMI_703]